MNDVPAALTDARLVAVRTVEIISGRGTSVTLSSVRCPVRARASAVEDCAACGRGGGIAQDALARGEFLSCACRAGSSSAGERAAEVGSVMPRAAVAVRASVAAAVAADALRASGVPAAPVVDGEGRPIGLVTEAELLRAGAAARVADAMARVALAVHEGAPVTDAATLMAREGVERLAVVGSDGAVVGVIGAREVVAWVAAEAALAARPR